MMIRVFGRYFHFLILIHNLMIGIVVCPSNPRVNELNVSREDPNPFALWSLLMSQHNTSALSMLQSTEHAILHNVPLLTSDPNALHPFMSLQGTSTSRVELPNAGGTMNGNLAMCWIFYIFPQQSQPFASSVLLHYKGSFPGGFQIRYLTSGKIQVKMHDSGGQPFTYDSTFTVNPEEWTMVGINYNHLWDIAETENMDIFTVDNKGVTEDGFIVDSAMISGTATGDISLGSTFDGTDSFYGHIYCVQFYPTSLIGGTQKDTPDICDPKLTTLLGNPSVDYSYYAALIGTTAITTEMSTLPETTTSETTTSESETTTPLTETTTSLSETTTLLATTPSLDTTTSATLTTQQIPNYQNSCSRYKKIQMGTTIQLPMITVQTNKPVICAKKCEITSDCSMFAIDVLAGVCVLGAPNTALVPSGQFNVFAKA